MHVCHVASVMFDSLDAMDCSPPGFSVHGIPQTWQYWSGLPCPPPGDLPDPGIELTSLFPALASGFFTTSTTWEASDDPTPDVIFTHQKVLPFCFQFKSAFGLG